MKRSELKKEILGKMCQAYLDHLEVKECIIVDTLMEELLEMLIYDFGQDYSDCLVQELVNIIENEDG